MPQTTHYFILIRCPIINLNHRVKPLNFNVWPSVNDLSWSLFCLRMTAGTPQCSFDHKLHLWRGHVYVLGWICGLAKYKLWLLEINLVNCGCHLDVLVLVWNQIQFHNLWLWHQDIWNKLPMFMCVIFNFSNGSSLCNFGLHLHFSPTSQT